MANQQQSPNEEKTYLGILRFDPKLMKSFAGRYLSNIRLMILFLMTVVIVGVGSYVSLPRTLNPEVEIPYIIVSTVLPGAGPEDVESLITDPIEQEIKRIKDVDNFTSSSQQNISIISVQFQEDVDVDGALDEVQKAVDRVTDFPEDAQKPSVRDIDFEYVPVLEFSLIKKGEDDIASLNRLAEKLKEEIEELSLIDQAEISGLDEREIQVLIRPEVFKEKGIDPQTLSQAVKNALSSYPAGNVLTGNSSFSFTIDQPANSVADLRDIPVYLQAGGAQERGIFTLSELAEVSEKSVPDQAASYIASHELGQKRAVTFTVYKTTSARIDFAEQQLQEAISEVMNEYQQDFEIKEITNYAELINTQFDDLAENFIQTLLLVFFSMFLIYGIRQALIASIAIPFSLLIVFASMSEMMFGFSLNFLTIFSLLIALGLFVDNAVVIIEAYTSYYRTGKFKPLETAILVWRDFFVELFSINLLTVWAFLPLLITSGIIGEFVKPLPIIVSISMMGSVVVAFLFTLPSMMLFSDFKLPKRVQFLLGIVFALLLAASLVFLLPQSVLLIPTIIMTLLLFVLMVILRKQIFSQVKQLVTQVPFVRRLLIFLRRAFDQGFVSLQPLSDRYRRIVTYLLSSRVARIQTLVVIIAFTIMSYLLLPLGFVVNEFFPKSDQELIYVQLEMPVGTNKTVTTSEALPLLDSLRKIPEAKFVTLQIQRSAGQGFDVTQPGPEKALFSLVLPEKDERDRTSIEIAQAIRDEFRGYSKGTIQVVEQTGGPPAGEDIEIQIFGDDLSQLSSYAAQVESFLERLEGTTNINRSIEEGKGKLVFDPNQEKMKQYGVAEGQIFPYIRTLSSGFTLDDVNFDDQERDIVLRMFETVPHPEDIGTVRIPLMSGGPDAPSTASLQELGSIQLKPAPSVITHKDATRSIKITASALPGYLPTELYKDVEKYMNGKKVILDEDIPEISTMDGLELQDGYSWEVGGVNQENQKSQQSIVQAMGISAILILVTMVVQLGSFRKALIVMLVIPLSLSGVFIWFALTATPISFPAMVGMLSLFGIVIANSLMIVDKVNQNTEAGFHMREAIIDASASRLEPIALTSISQIIGLIPITLADPLWRGLGGSIIAGLSFSGTIMLFFIPVVYYYLYPESQS